MPAGGLPVRRHHPRQHRLRPARRDRRRDRAAARAAARTSSSSGLPDGYDTEVGERGGHLSAGQRQPRLRARARLADPRILILDEATSSVDVRTEAADPAGARRCCGPHRFVIAHRLSTIRDADRIVVLDHGRIVEHGTHDELLERRRLRAALPRLGPPGGGLVGTGVCADAYTARRTRWGHGVTAARHLWMWKLGFESLVPSIGPRRVRPQTRRTRAATASRARAAGPAADRRRAR